MKIFIAGSSHDNIPKKYLDLATTVSKLLSKNNTLILGGIPSNIPSNSMMGIYNSNFQSKEYLTVKMYTKNISIEEKNNSTILDYTMDRTKQIYMKSDIIVFLPGGIGTLSELASFIEESRTNKTNKKIIIYNYEGFFNNIINWLNNNTNNNFISENDLKTYKIVTNNQELEKEMERY